MSVLFSLDDKVAVVTGGRSGIGLATVERLSAAGARIVIADLEDATPLAERVGGVSIVTDVSQEAQVERLMSEARERLGRVDIVVNNAGVHRSYERLVDSRAADYEFCFRVNTLGVVYGIKHGAAVMSDGGSIVNIASLAAAMGVAGLSTYSASKWPIVGLTKTAALELASRRIRVNAICPSTVRTPMALTDDGQDLIDVETALVPLGRICEPEEVAALVHFLAADDCTFLNGQAINLCGGQSAGWSEAVWERLAGE